MSSDSRRAPAGPSKRIDGTSGPPPLDSTSGNERYVKSPEQHPPYAAGCTWIADRLPCDAAVDIRDDGTARISCGTQDIGTGTYTILAQIVSDKLGIPLAKVDVVIGDTTLPPGPISGGSMATASVVPAVLEAVGKAIETLLAQATKLPGSPFAKQKLEDLAYNGGRIHAKGQPAESGIAFDALLKQGNLKLVSGRGSSNGTLGEKEKPKFSSHSFGAHFLEVTWQPEIVRLRVSRVVTVIDAGRIINPLAGRNQIEGSIVMGIGMGLLEETSYDPRTGAPINSNLADYVMATNADVPALEVHFLNYPDLELIALGARRIGEIGLGGFRGRAHERRASRDGRPRAGAPGEDRASARLRRAAARGGVRFVP